MRNIPKWQEGGDLKDQAKWRWVNSRQRGEAPKSAREVQSTEPSGERLFRVSVKRIFHWSHWFHLFIGQMRNLNGKHQKKCKGGEGGTWWIQGGRRGGANSGGIKGGIGAFAPHPLKALPPHPPVRRKKCKNQPFWQIFGFLPPQKTHFALSMSPQKKNYGAATGCEAFKSAREGEVRCTTHTAKTNFNIIHCMMLIQSNT